ncbi:DUF5107 domain-containing protein, partial [Streptomyces sp. B1866]|uniref:DUF5107 domain-containing protein n=1 Tax=Streptomyces sp. B1866 TaxID=3075431 RepID=UPI002891EFCB
MATSVRRTSLTLPTAPLGPGDPLPALYPLDQAGPAAAGTLPALPVRAAREARFAPPRSALPERLRDGYGRRRAPVRHDAVVIENTRLRAVVLPGLGGRIHSLHHKPTGRELLHAPAVLQPAHLAPHGAWYAGGLQWHTGTPGRTGLSCAPLHAARLPAPDGGEMVRLWEWDRLRDLPFQVDLWLPEGTDFLYVGVRVRNPHHDPAPVFWQSRAAVPEAPGTRVLTPADGAWHAGGGRPRTRVPVPEWDGADRSYPLRGEEPADYHYDPPAGERPWIAALDASGTGLVQTSAGPCGGRGLALWGAGPAGRRRQRWLAGPGAPGWAELWSQPAPDPLGHVRLEPYEEVAWLEAYGPLSADPRTVHGGDWAAARREVADRLEAAAPRAAVAEAYAAWRACADTEPKEQLATGSGWGALEVERGGHELPGTPFPPDTLGPEQEPWRRLLRTGALPDWPAGPLPADPGPSLVAPVWRDLLEAAPGTAAAEYHLGVAQWHAGDRAQAERSWERSLRCAETPWALRCLAVADTVAGHPVRAAQRLLRAVGLLLPAGALAAAGSGGPASDGRAPATEA